MLIKPKYLLQYSSYIKTINQKKVQRKVPNECMFKKLTVNYTQGKICPLRNYRMSDTYINSLALHVAV